MKMIKVCFCVLALLGSTAFKTLAALPAGFAVEPAGGLAEEADLMVATQPVKVSTPVPNGASTLVIVGRAGKESGGLAVEITWDDESTTKLFAKAGGDGQVPDSYLQIMNGKRLFIRPNLAFYATPARKKAMVDGWEQFPPASSHLLKIEVRTTAKGAQVWFDDRFIQAFPAQRGHFARVDIDLSTGAGVQRIDWSQQAPGKFLPLAVEAFARPAAWADIMGSMGWLNAMGKASLSVAAGPATVGGIPFKVAPSSQSVDVSGMGFLACPIDDLVSSFWRRSTLDALPEACIMSVPLDTYSHAYVLCAAEDDPTKLSEFTLRMTRNSNGRGDAYADTEVRIPKAGEANPDAKQVGTVDYGSGGNHKRVPLWLIRVPLKSGLIQDILREDESMYGFSVPLPTDRYLDIELMEPLDGVDENDVFPMNLQGITKRHYNPHSKRTSMHVFGVTLESSPAELTVKATAPVNAFYAEENPALKAEVLPKESGKYEVSWSFADIDGAIAATGSKEITATKGVPQTVTIPVKVSNGWYSSQVKLRDASGGALVDYRGTFTMLPPDTRKAGAESPYGTWWFNWAHGGTKDFRRVGALMEKAGLRHTMLESNETMAASKVTTWAIPWKQPRAESVQMWVDDLEAQIRKRLEKAPETTTVMIHHETDSYNGRFPSELWGETPAPLSDKDEAAWVNRMRHMIPGLKMIREKFPKLKIQIGNTGDSCALVAEMFRHGLPKEYVDYYAVEDLGQIYIPEKPILGGLQSAWYLRETARHFGYTEAKLTGCYEWINRMHMNLGLRTQAEWYVRDALHARAYGFHTIALGAIHDAGQGYFHSIWGNGGFCFRYPEMNPKPAYAAMATHTRVLDSTTFERLAPTGSHSLYAMEFKREGQWIYAVWVPRGTREAKVHFGSDAPVTVIDLYGREKSVKGPDFDLTASTSVQYLVSSSQLVGMTPGKSSFPLDLPPEKATVIDPMESMNQWVAEAGEEIYRVKGTNFPFRRPAQGKFEVRAANDEEKGKCLEIELKPEGELWPMIYEHTWVKQSIPQLMEGGPYSYVGVWVKGNSSWGEIIASIGDIDGKSHMILPNGQGDSNLDFDGWNFLRFKIPDGLNWKGPIALNGFLVTIPRKVLYGTEFVPVDSLKIRMKGACFF